MKTSHIMQLLSAVLCAFSFMSCGSDSDLLSGYDASKPVTLTTFYPDSGRFQEKVILNGSNFGTDVSKIRVYFNHSRAAVIGATNTKVYVQAPRLPGDTCVLSVVIGNDSTTYDKTFKYKESITVSTIAGNGILDEIVTGDLSTSQLHPMYLCVDGDNNIFVISRGIEAEADAHNAIMRINEQANDISILIDNEAGNVPCVDEQTGIVTLPTETTVGSYLSMDPAEMWGSRVKEMLWPEGYSIPANGYKHCMVVNPSDGYIYTRYYYGDIVRINPKTYEITPVYKTQQGDSYGLAFSPLHPNILYMSFRDNGGTMANSICSIDVTKPDSTYQRLSSSNVSGGHRDGKLDRAQFHNPTQIYCDKDGFMYVADRDNHCIRRISPDNMVETVLGIPGTQGWKDGTKDEALFNQPTGIGIAKDGTVYVADWANGRVRKLTIN